MNTQKFILGILGLGIILGVGFAVVAVVKTNNTFVEQGNTEKPVEVPETPKENPVSNFPEFGKAITLKLNDKITFSDGLVVIVTEINDSRCPKDVQCIWAGEISAVLELSGGNISQPGEIRLGTVMNKSANPEGYTIILQNANEKSVTIVVKYKKP